MGGPSRAREKLNSLSSLLGGVKVTQGSDRRGVQLFELGLWWDETGRVREMERTSAANERPNYPGDQHHSPSSRFSRKTRQALIVKPEGDPNWTSDSNGSRPSEGGP